jgi:hypothetical protein
MSEETFKCHGDCIAKVMFKRLRYVFELEKKKEFGDRLHLATVVTRKSIKAIKNTHHEY